MRLLLEHKVFTDLSTLGDLYVDGTLECYSLEHPQRSQKIVSLTGIPSGTFTVDLTRSPHFSIPHGPRICPILLNVPNFDGIRIHHGNKPSDSDGCILVGQTKGPGSVYKSRPALARLIRKMRNAKRRGEAITIQIK